MREFKIKQRVKNIFGGMLVFAMLVVGGGFTISRMATANAASITVSQISFTKSEVATVELRENLSTDQVANFSIFFPTSDYPSSGNKAVISVSQPNGYILTDLNTDSACPNASGTKTTAINKDNTISKNASSLDFCFVAQAAGKYTITFTYEDKQIAANFAVSDAGENVFLPTCPEVASNWAGAISGATYSTVDLAENWAADRTLPTFANEIANCNGETTYLTAFAAADANATDYWYRWEGVKQTVASAKAQILSGAIYIDTSEPAQISGLWAQTSATYTYDGYNDAYPAYPQIVYCANSDGCNINKFGAHNTETQKIPAGWNIYNSFANSWENVAPVEFASGWHNVEIATDETAPNTVNYYLDGAKVYAAADQDATNSTLATIDFAMLQSYNSGTENFATYYANLHTGVYATTPEDTTPPAAELSVDEVIGKNGVVNLAVANNGGSGISRTIAHFTDGAGNRCYNSTTDRSASGANEFSYEFNLVETCPNLVEGKITVQYGVQNTAGLWSKTASKTFTLDLTPPTMVATANSIINADGKVSVSVTENGGSTIERIVAHIYDSAGNTCWNNQVVEPNAAAKGQTIFSYEFNLKQACPNLVDSNIKILYSATDAVGNSGKLATLNIALDTVAPTGTVTYSPTNLTNGKVVATLETSEPIATPTGWRKIDDTHFAKEYSKNTNETAILTDSAGNIGSVKVDIANIDTTKPIVANIKTTVSEDGRSLTVTGKISDNVQLGRYSCAIYAADGTQISKITYAVGDNQNGTICPDQTDISAFKNGDYYVNIWVEDAVLNTNTYVKIAAFTVANYAVNFEMNGGSDIANIAVKSGEIIARPDDPTRENYTFGGWFADENFSTEFDFSQPITADTTIFAKWTENVVDNGDNSTNNSDENSANNSGNSSSESSPANSATSTANVSTPIARTLANVANFANGDTMTDNEAVATNGSTDDVISVVPISSDLATNFARADNSGEVLGVQDSKHWALLNLILAILTALASIAMLVAWLGKGENDDNRHGLLRMLTLIPAVGAVVAFFLTENWTLPMKWVDVWTALMAIIVVVQIVLVVLAARHNQKTA